MESKSFTLEHKVYKDTFSRTCSDRLHGVQCGKSDESSPSKRKYQQTQPNVHLKPCKLEPSFSHEHGQVVENSHQLLSRLGGLFKNPDLSDVRLVIVSGTDDKREYPAHKLVLCCASEVFKIMLTGSIWNESNTSEVCLREDSDLSPVFESFLEYLYCGRITLSHSTVLNVLALADKYLVKDLQDVCMNYMCSHLVSTVEQNRSVSWLQYGRLAGHNHLANECQQFICWNFYKVLSCPDFLLMEYDVLLFFLKQSDLVIPDEFILYQGVVRWWLNGFNPPGPNAAAPTDPKTPLGDRADETESAGVSSDFDCAFELFTHIRFPLMTHTQLNAITSDVSQFRQTPIGQPDPNGNRLKVLLIVVDGFARNALALQDTIKSADHCKFEDAQVMPRNYTNEVWSTTLCIDKFSTLPQHEVRSVVFSSPSSSLLPDDTNPAWDWTVELFPKGVAFQRCIMIGLWRNVEVHGDVYNTVRLALHCNQSKDCSSWDKADDHWRGKRDVVVCVLVTGVQDNVEHICRVEERSLSFDGVDRTRHINDLVPFHHLNETSFKGYSSSSSNRSDSSSSCSLLCGPEGDLLKITIVIKPSCSNPFKERPRF